MEDNPYSDVYDQVAILCNEPSPCLGETNHPSELAKTQQIRKMVRADTPSLVGASAIPRNEALQALIPTGLNLSIKTGHGFQPHVTTPERFRPISHVASVYEVKFPLSVTPRLVKSPSQSPTRSSNQSPTRSLGTIEEEGSTDSSAGLKRKSTVHSGRVHKKLFGDNGWLDDPKSPRTPRRRSSVMREFGKKLKQLVSFLSSIEGQVSKTHIYLS